MFIGSIAGKTLFFKTKSRQGFRKLFRITSCGIFISKKTPVGMLRMLEGRDPAGSMGALEIAQRAWRRLAGLFVAGHLLEGKHVVCAPWDAHGGIFLPTLD